MIFDVESDGLLDKATKIHVLSYTTPQGIKHTHDYDKMREVLTSAKLLIGHNIIMFDVPLVEKILGIKIKAKLIDTLALSWYLNHRRNVHGLEAYGVEFGVPKPEINDWENLTQEEYAHRCNEDVKINKRLWNSLKNKLLKIYGDKKEADRLINYLTFKLKCASEQERHKWLADKVLIQNSFDQLQTMQDEKIKDLQKVMPKVKKYVVKTKPAKCYKKDGSYSVTGAKWFNLLKEKGLDKDFNGEIKVLAAEEEPNPNSTEQVKDWLFGLGWSPATFKYVKDSDGSERKIPQIRVDGENGKELCPSVTLLIDKHPSVELLEGLSVIQHRLSIFKGFLENLDKEDQLTASIGGLTNTLRFKHRVLVNLPGVDKSWGKEIRGSLIAREGHLLCGSDMTSLEDTTKKHYMWDHDPNFVLEMSKEGFDPHLDLAIHAKAVTQEEVDKYNGKDKEYAYVKGIRKGYKAANYACIYGVGAPKLARETGLTVGKAKKLIEAYWERNHAVKKVIEETVTKKVDGEMWLFNPVSKLWYSLRNEKDIFSTLNQGTGVFCFDSWIREIMNIRSKITKYQLSIILLWLLGQFHDEIILEIHKDAKLDTETILKEAIHRVNEKLNLNVKLDVDVQFGKTYAEIH